MPVLRLVRPIVVLLLVVFGAFPAQLGAQDATPIPGSPPDGGITARMTSWRQAHPQATFADMERAATRQFAPPGPR